MLGFVLQSGKRALDKGGVVTVRWVHLKLLVDHASKGTIYKCRQAETSTDKRQGSQDHTITPEHWMMQDTKRGEGVQRGGTKRNGT